MAEKTENTNEAETTKDIEDPNTNETSDEFANQNISYSLKVLNGPHAGAELSLSDKNWVVGRADTSDVALLDETLKEQHAKFSLRDG